jgi:hypothetical protein
MIDFINFVKNFSLEYMDIILEYYTFKNRANVVRLDLESYISGHLGVIFQDRNKFQSIVEN